MKPFKKVKELTLSQMAQGPTSLLLTWVDSILLKVRMLERGPRICKKILKLKVNHNNFTKIKTKQRCIYLPKATHHTCSTRAPILTLFCQDDCCSNIAFCRRNKESGNLLCELKWTKVTIHEAYRSHVRHRTQKKKKRTEIEEMSEHWALRTSKEDQIGFLRVRILLSLTESIAKLKPFFPKAWYSSGAFI